MPQQYSRNRFAIVSLLLLLICMTLSPVQAQFYNGSQMQFGKNRVQYKHFIWTFYRLNRIDTYFYQGGKELAQYAASYATRELDVMERDIDYQLIEKIQFLVFNNYSDLRQSNIGLADNETYNTGGMATIVGNRVLLYFDGDLSHFEEQIRKGIAKMMFNQMTYGSSIGAQLKNQALYKTSDWYELGMIDYLSKPWGPKEDEALRNLFIHKRVKKFKRLLNGHAALAGHSMWHFIEQTFGEAQAKAIIHSSRTGSGLDHRLMYNIGIDSKMLYKEWQKYYTNIYNNEAGDSITNNYLPIKYVKERQITGICQQPGGHLIAYTTNELGQSSLFIYDTIKRRNKRKYKKGFRLNDFTDISYPVMAWHPKGSVLAFITEEEGLIYLNLYKTATDKIDKINMHQFGKICQISYHPDGRYLIMSASREGQSDLYYYDIAANSYQQLTFDSYDDAYPCFDANGKYIYFCSNRPHDSLFPKNKLQPKLDYKAVFAYSFQQKKPHLIPISKNAFGDCSYPQAKSNNEVLYLSDQSGRNNLYKATIDSVISHIDTIVHYRYQSHSYPLSNWKQAPYFLSVDRKDQKILLLQKNDQYDRAYAIPYSSLPTHSVLPLYTVAMSNTLRAKHLQHHPPVDSNAVHSVKRRRFYVARSNVKSKVIGNYKGDSTAITGINDIKHEKIKIPESISDTFHFPKQQNYYVEFFVNKIIARLDYSYLNTSYQPYTGGDNDFFFGPDGNNGQNNSPVYLDGGYNGFFEMGITDLMEDYRLSGGVKLNPTFSNNEYLFSYSNLKNRADYKLLFHRQIFENNESYYILRTYSHELILQRSYPFNEALSWRSSLGYKNQLGVYLNVNSISLEKDERMQNWGTLRQELVYDAARSLGLNLYEGTRFKLFGEYYQQFESIQKNLFVVGFDFRKYTRIHRCFIWANRFAGSSSFGRNKLLYYMGGVDNWLVPKFNNNTPIDYREQWAFQTLATNMRGFDQNIRNGNNFLLINSELRFPVFRYFYDRPLQNSFINNFQIVGFGDLGTAWTGWDPFSKDNSLYTYYIHNGPLNIRVETERDPLVGGFGAGLRSQILGYFIRADLAWGIEDMQVTEPQFYLSFSLDF